MTTGPMVLVPDAAKLLGVSERRVYALIKTKMLATTTHIDQRRRMLIYLVSLESINARLAWDKAGRVGKAPHFD